ncbi:hypothetical protein COO60DRAFT_1212814 [Scenedesmus sp. NREL 46B-D3]|nr:hypothetical protein COO60DRAFT_1212814 [Scenedesmus sp. NREL 46B-D3]
MADGPGCFSCWDRLQHSSMARMCCRWVARYFVERNNVEQHCLRRWSVERSVGYGSGWLAGCHTLLRLFMDDRCCGCGGCCCCSCWLCALCRFHAGALQGSQPRSSRLADCLAFELCYIHLTVCCCTAGLHASGLQASRMMQQLLWCLSSVQSASQICHTCCCTAGLLQGACRPAAACSSGCAGCPVFGLRYRMLLICTCCCTAGLLQGPCGSAV